MFFRRLALAIGLLFGLVGAQLPELAQQYRQRVGGALDELNRIMAQFDAEAAAQSLTRAQGIERLKENSDILAHERGVDIENDIARAARLERQLDALKNGGPLERLAVFAEDFDAPTVRRALQDFEPAVPVTAEAFVVGAISVVIGWAATHLAAWPIRRGLRARARRREARASA